MRNCSIMLAATALAIATPALSVEAGAGIAVARRMPEGLHDRAVMSHWGPKVRGRWFAGWRAPGGWAAYRRPVAGYILPSYWVRPAYRIGNYGVYGLPTPAPGYGWFRYYDDAVMTDPDGRVRDHREGIAWDRADGPPPPPMVYDDDVTAPDRPQHPEHDVQEHHADGRHGVDYDAPPYKPPYDGPPPIVHHNGAGQPVVTTTQAPGYYADGYYFPGATTTTVVVQPTITTTRTYVTETLATPRRHRRR